MHALIVLAHPLRGSATHTVAGHIARGIRDSDQQHTAEVADLNAEGFDPRFTEADIEVHQNSAQVPADVAAEQSRIAHADALVLVYPIYWWSFPALLKGWIDRVFTRGWAFDESRDGGLIKKLEHLPIHLFALGGADRVTFARRGYADAMNKQIEQGIFGFCGAQVMNSSLLLASDAGFPATHFEVAYAAGRSLFTPAGNVSVTPE